MYIDKLDQQGHPDHLDHLYLRGNPDHLDHIDDLDHLDHLNHLDSSDHLDHIMIQRFIMKINAEFTLFTWSCFQFAEEPHCVY